MDEAELDGVTGPDLFKQFLRLLPTADHLDYCRNGIWQDKVMRLDARILIGHRQEAGAPEVIPLEEVKLPENLPKATVAGASASPFPGMKPGPSAVVSVLAPKIVKPPTPLVANAGKVVPPSMTGPKGQGKLQPALASRTAAKPAVIPKLGSAVRVATKPGSVVSPAGSKLQRAMAAVAALRGKGKAKSGKGGTPTPPPRPPPSVSGQGFAQRAKGKGVAPPKANPAYKVGFGKGKGKTVPASNGSVSSAVANDLKQISAFVAKHQLDTSQTKLALAKLTPQKRNYVMTHFTSGYGSGSHKLEPFIANCTRTNVWGAAASSSASRVSTPPRPPFGQMSAVAAARARLGQAQGARPTPLLGRTGAGIGQLKRPMPLSSASAAAVKRPRLGVFPQVGGSVGPRPVPHFSTVAGPAGGKGGMRIPHVVPKYGEKPVPHVVPKGKGAPAPHVVAGQKGASSSWSSQSSWGSSSSSAGAKGQNPWTSSSKNGTSKGADGKKSWNDNNGKSSSWNDNKSWGNTPQSWRVQPQQPKPNTPGKGKGTPAAGIIANLLSKY